MSIFIRNSTTCLLAFGLLLGTGCATTKMDWEEANRQGTVEAYGKFLRDHPDADQAALAKNRMIDSAWRRTQTINTIEGYKHFIQTYPQAEQGSRAKEELEKLEVTRDWEFAKAASTIAALDEFSQQHPHHYTDHITSARQKLEISRDWETAVASNTSRAFKDFLRLHPSSQHDQAARERRRMLQLEEAWTEAATKNNETGWHDFIDMYSSSPRCNEAVAKLQALPGRKPGSPAFPDNGKRPTVLRGRMTIQMIMGDRPSSGIVILSRCTDFIVKSTEDAKFDSSFGPSASQGILIINPGSLYRIVGYLSEKTIVASEIVKERDIEE
ncbi:MAG: hypothetical protein P0120_07875 [Nitrospira sp.]|nr:hypothetical protein [Nitrospira sp.]